MASLLKDIYDLAFLQRLADGVQAVSPSFSPSAFLESVLDAHWEQRELKDRMKRITQTLHAHLPGSFAEQISLLQQVVWEGQALEQLFYPDFVEQYGLDHPEVAFQALEYFTPFASAEFAIRPFFLKYPNETLACMKAWSQHPDHHVRRLASEGSRPRLPWGMALKDFQRDPAPILPILHQLFLDPSEYVRRSVANNLNDISKDHPELAYQIGKEWLEKDASTNTQRLVKHALRTLLKKGHTRALLLFGFADPAAILLAEHWQSAPKITLGDRLQFGIKLVNQAQKAQLIRLEYGIDFQKKNGKTSRKIFQWSEKEIPPGTMEWKKEQAFKDLTTRKHYPGKHRLVILVNGQEKGAMDFDLVVGEKP